MVETKGGEAMTPRTRTTAEVEAGADSTAWARLDNPASRIKRRLEGVAIYTGIATTAHLKREDDGDEHDLAAKQYFDMRNEAMREIHRLVDQLAADADAAPAVEVTVDEATTLVQEYGERCYINATNNPNAIMIDMERALRDRIIALLTSQPGTHDDAGQATEGGV